MGNSKSRKETLSTRTGTIQSSRNKTLTTPDLRSTIFSNRSFSQIEQQIFLNNLNQDVIDHISSFLTIKDLINLQCTNSRIYEIFYNTLPYSIHVQSILYRNYQDARGVLYKAVRINRFQWTTILRDYIETKSELKQFIFMKRSFDCAFQNQIIYPPKLLDEAQSEGLSSDLQRIIMTKSKNEFKNVTELQLIENAKNYIKKHPNILLEIRTLRKFDYEKIPKLFQIVVVALRCLHSTVAMIQQTLDCAIDVQDPIGYLDFYLYNWHQYKIWMQTLDSEVGPYLDIFDTILQEQYPNYEFPKFSIYWIMISIWNQAINGKENLKYIFTQTLIQCRQQELKYEKFLLRDYVRHLLDISIHQGNIKQAGHSQFRGNMQFEQILQQFEHQTRLLYDTTTMDIFHDINTLKYVFQQNIFEKRLLTKMLQLQYQKIQEIIQNLINSPEYARRSQRIEDQQFLATPQIYEMTWLSNNRIQSKIQQIINNKELAQSTHEFSLRYQKIEYDKPTLYLMNFNKELYETLEKLVTIDIEAQENVTTRDHLIKTRVKLQDVEEHLASYERLPPVEELKTILKNAKQKKQIKSKSEPSRQEYQRISLQTGLSLAQSIRQQSQV
ncbi:hypothetical protein pb186bvf_020864 [Paramecium bursaria]